MTFYFLLQKEDISRVVRKNISRVFSILICRCHDERQARASTTNTNTEAMNEWLTDDVYESDLPKSHSPLTSGIEMAVSEKQQHDKHEFQNVSIGMKSYNEKNQHHANHEH